MAAFPGACRAVESTLGDDEPERPAFRPSAPKAPRQLRSPPPQGEQGGFRFPPDGGGGFPPGKRPESGQEEGECLRFVPGLGEERRGELQQVVGVPDPVPIRHDIPEGDEDRRRREDRHPPRLLRPGHLEEKVLLQCPSEAFPASAGGLGDDVYRPVGLREKGEPPVCLPHIRGTYEECAGGPEGTPAGHLILPAVRRCFDRCAGKAVPHPEAGTERAGSDSGEQVLPDVQASPPPRRIALPERIPRRRPTLPA
jgi:hypothetical protein